MKTVSADPAWRGWLSVLLPSTKSTVVASQHFWALLDQGCVSGGNFLTTILLARALEPAQYGVYALLYGIILTMNNVHSALIWYGMSLKAAICSEDELGSLVGGALAITGWLGLLLGVVLVAVAIFFCTKAAALLILVAMLFGQLQETTRRALMARLRYRDAVYGDALSYLGQAGCIAYLLSRRRSGLAEVFAVLAISSAAGMLLQAIQLRLALSNLKRRPRLISGLWRVGRWALVANLVHNGGTQVLLWFLAFFGTAKVASFQATTNVLNATNPIAYSVGNVILPTVASGRGKDAFANTKHHGIRGAMFIAPFMVLVIIAPHLVLRCFYGADSAYLRLERELRMLIIANLIAYVAYILGAYYYGLGRSDVVLWANCGGSAAILLVGLYLCFRYGTLGAVEAYDLSVAARAAVLFWWLHDGVSVDNRGAHENRVVAGS
jgi:O-antigen/teichoic acid export membrane protein